MAGKEFLNLNLINMKEIFKILKINNYFNIKMDIKNFYSLIKDNLLITNHKYISIILFTVGAGFILLLENSNDFIISSLFILNRGLWEGI
jgi:hypothetical protein